MAICKRIVFAILLAAWRVAVCQDASLVLTPKGDQTIAVGDAGFGIICQGNQASNQDGVFTEMKWLDPQGNEIEADNSRINVKPHFAGGIRLSFQWPKTEDSGQYTCQALYDNSLTLEEKVNINFYEEMKFGNCPEVQNLVVGDEGCVICKIDSKQQTMIEWQKNKQSLKGYDYDVSTGCLKIAEVRPEHEGLYTIEAFELSGRTKYRNITVKVLTPPRIVSLRDKYDVIEGEEYVLSCRAEGTKPLMYTWLDHGMRDLGQEPGYIVNQELGELTIKKVSRNDAGNYTCQVENLAGPKYKVEAQVQVVVQVRPAIEEFNNVTTQSGESAEIRCVATGIPPPLVRIRKEGSYTFIDDEMDGRVKLERTEEGDRHVLTIRYYGIRRSDDGLYYCEATNDAAEVSRVGHITVQFKPDMSSWLKEDMKVVKVWKGKPANLSCYAEAMPNASLSWKFNDQPITPDQQVYRIQGGTSHSHLIIQVDDYEAAGVLGIYTCDARNGLGNDSRRIQLELATPPSKIDQVVFDKTTPTSITFIINGPSETGGLEIQYYTLKYRRIDIDGQPQLIHKWEKIKGSARYLLGGLTPRAKYAYSITASNLAGEGVATTTDYIIMPEETPPESPKIVRDSNQEIIRSPYADRYDVRWSVPENGGKPIDAFFLRCLKVERNAQGNWQQVGNAIIEAKIDWEAVAEENTEYALTGLESETTYRIEIRAHNSLGNSQPDILYFQTKPGKSSDQHTKRMEDNVISLPGIIAIVVVALLITLLIIDVVSFFRFHCGLLYFMRYRSCGRSPEKVQATLEDGRACVKEVSTANNGKIKTELKTPSPDQLPPPETKEVRPSDLIIDENFKNKSPKGSKTSIGKSSPV